MLQMTLICKEKRTYKDWTLFFHDVRDAATVIQNIDDCIVAGLDSSSEL